MKLSPLAISCLLSLGLFGAARADLEVIANESTGRVVPPGELVSDASGTLFGVTLYGGSGDRTYSNSGQIQNGGGVFFQVTPGVGDGAAVLADFSPVAGKSVHIVGGLTAHADGNFYGASTDTVSPSDSSARAAVVRLSASGEVREVAVFPSTLGVPSNALLAGSDGAFYGIARRALAFPLSGYEADIYKVTLSPAAVSKVATLPKATYDGAALGCSVPLAEGADGNLYAVAAPLVGGILNVIKCTKAGVLSEVVGSAPGAVDGQGGLLFLPDGRLIGVTRNSGPNATGAVYEVSPSGGFRVLKGFTTLAGELQRPVGRMFRTPDGTLIGACLKGGINGEGGIFKLTPVPQSSPVNYSFSKVYDFAGSNAAVFEGAPVAGLVAGTDGKLYGLTDAQTYILANAPMEGSPSRVFAFDPVTNAVSFVHTFDSPHGRNFTGRPLMEGDSLTLMAPRGTSGDDGTLLKVDLTGAQPVTALVPDSAPHFFRGASGVSRGGDGALYSVVERDASGAGTINGALLKVDGSGAVTVLKSFNQPSQSPPQPVGGLLARANGELWGTVNYTSNNSPVICGIFKVDTAGAYQTVVNLDANTVGTNSRSNLVENAAGDAVFGVAGNQVFKIDAANTASVFATLAMPDQTRRLILSPAGILYGVSTSALFKVSAGGVFTLLKSFATSASDAKVLSEGYGVTDVAAGDDGFLYGTCAAGGENGAGTIWRLDPATKIFTRIFSLNGSTQGAGPNAIGKLKDGRLCLVTPGSVLAFVAPRPGNKAPKALPDVVNLPVVDFDVTANDSDADGDALSILAVGAAAKGSVTFSGGKLSYVPKPGFSGTDKFSYTIGDGFGGTATASVTVTNLSPVQLAAGTFRAVMTAPDAPNATWLVVQATLTAKGGLSGSVTKGGKKTPFHGTLPASGAFVATLLDEENAPVTLSLTLDMTGGVPRLLGQYGSVSFAMERPAFTKAHPAPAAGTYTALLREAAFTAGHPHGMGFAQIRLSTLGAVSIAGKLADGTPFSSSAAQLNDGSIPFSVPVYKTALYSSRGFLTGTLRPVQTPVTADFDGTLTWQKPATLHPLGSTLYPAGFTLESACSAARFVRRAPMLLGLPVGGALSITLRYGGMSEENPASAPVVAAGAMSATSVISIAPPNAPALALKVNASTGLLTGSVTTPAAGKQTIFGVAQERENVIGGQFNAGSGVLLISP